MSLKSFKFIKSSSEAVIIKREGKDNYQQHFDGDEVDENQPLIGAAVFVAPLESVRQKVLS